MDARWWGGAVMGRLMLSSFPQVMALSSLLTVAAGFFLYALESGGFQMSWILSPAGITLSIGALAGIVAFIMGLTLQKPATDRILAVQKEIQAGGKPPTAAQMQVIEAQQAIMAVASRWEAVLMIIAVAGMATARELGRM